MTPTFSGWIVLVGCVTSFTPTLVSVPNAYFCTSCFSGDAKLRNRPKDDRTRRCLHPKLSTLVWTMSCRNWGTITARTFCY